MHPAAIFSAGLGAAHVIGDLAKDATVSDQETAHEKSPEHAGFREELEDMRAGVLGLVVTVGLTTGLMALFAKKNEEEHKKMQSEIKGIFCILDDFVVTDTLTELPAYSQSRPTLPGHAEHANTFGALKVKDLPDDVRTRIDTSNIKSIRYNNATAHLDAGERITITYEPGLKDVWQFTGPRGDKHWRRT